MAKESRKKCWPQVTRKVTIWNFYCMRPFKAQIRIVYDFLYADYDVNEAENQKNLSYIDPLTVEFFSE